MTTPGERISAIEARLEYLATKTEVAEAKGELKVGLARVGVWVRVVMALASITITAAGTALSIAVRNWPT